MNETENNRRFGGFRKKMRQIAENRYFQPLIIAVILFNGVLIVAESYLPGQPLLLALDNVVVWVFVVELLIKMTGFGIRGYFRDPWNHFDFSIVALSLIFYNTPLVSVLRLVRVLRLIRLIPAIPALKRIIDSLLRSIPALTGILGLSILIFSIYAIIGTTFFRDVLPYEYFGSFHTSLFTLMQVITFESWASQVARPVINELPWAWVYFISFIVIAAFVVLNLVVAVILDYLGQSTEEEHKAEMERLYRENAELREDVREIKTILLKNQE